MKLYQNSSLLILISASLPVCLAEPPPEPLLDPAIYPTLVADAIGDGFEYVNDRTHSYVVADFVPWYVPNPEFECKAGCSAKRPPPFCLCTKPGDSSSFRRVFRSGTWKDVPTTADCNTDRSNKEFDYSYCDVKKVGPDIPAPKETFKSLFGFDYPITALEISSRLRLHAFFNHPHALLVSSMLVTSVMCSNAKNMQPLMFLLYWALNFLVVFILAGVPKAHETFITFAISGLVYVSGPYRHPASITSICMPFAVLVFGGCAAYFEIDAGGMLLFTFITMLLGVLSLTFFLQSSSVSIPLNMISLYATNAVCGVAADAMTGTYSGTIVELVWTVIRMCFDPVSWATVTVPRNAINFVNLCRALMHPNDWSSTAWRLIYFLVILVAFIIKLILVASVSIPTTKGPPMQRLFDAIAMIIPQTFYDAHNSFTYFVNGQFSSSFKSAFRMVTKLMMVTSCPEVAIVSVLVYIVHYFGCGTVEFRARFEGYRGGRLPYELFDSVKNATGKIQGDVGYGTGTVLHDKLFTIHHVARLRSPRFITTESQVKLSEPASVPNPSTLDPISFFDLSNSSIKPVNLPIIENSMWPMVRGLHMINCNGDIMSTGDFSINVNSPHAIDYMLDTYGGDSGSLIIADIPIEGTGKHEYFVAGVHASGYGPAAPARMNSGVLFRPAHDAIQVESYALIHHANIKPGTLAVRGEIPSISPHEGLAAWTKRIGEHMDKSQSGVAPPTSYPTEYHPAEPFITSTQEYNDRKAAEAMRVGQLSRRGVGFRSGGGANITEINHAQAVFSPPVTRSQAKKVRFTEEWPEMQSSTEDANRQSFIDRITSATKLPEAEKALIEFYADRLIKVDPSLSGTEAQLLASGIGKTGLSGSQMTDSELQGVINRGKPSHLTPREVYDKLLTFIKTGTSAPSNNDFDKFDVSTVPILKDVRNLLLSGKSLGEHWINSNNIPISTLRDAVLKVFKGRPINALGADLLDHLLKELRALPS